MTDLTSLPDEDLQLVCRDFLALYRIHTKAPSLSPARYKQVMHDIEQSVNYIKTELGPIPEHPAFSPHLTADKVPIYPLKQQTVYIDNPSGVEGDQDILQATVCSVSDNYVMVSPSDPKTGFAHFPLPRTYSSVAAIPNSDTRPIYELTSAGRQALLFNAKALQPEDDFGRMDPSLFDDIPQPPQVHEVRGHSRSNRP